MSIEECYIQIGADYEDAVRRLGNQERVTKFLLLFAEDDSYARLVKAIQENQGKEAFRAAHSLKGICLNLSLTALLQPAQDLAGELRDGQITEAAKPMAEQVKKEYQRVLQCIEELKQEGK